MPERPRLGGGIAVLRLGEILDHEAGAAQSADKFLPAMHELERAFLSMLELAMQRWHRPLGIIILGDGVAIRERRRRSLEVGRLFVLAEVLPADAQHAGDLVVNFCEIRHVASADRLGDEVERRVGEHRQIIHRRGEGSQLETALVGDLPIPLEHLRADVHHRDLGPGGGVERRLQTAATGETENVFAVESAIKPAPAIDGFERVGELVVARGASVQQALADALVPHTAVVILGNFHAAVLALAKR